MNIKVYHISPIQNRKSILKYGLIPNQKNFGRIKYGPSLFISTNKKDLGFDYVNFENVDCWEFEVDSKTIKKDPFSGSSNHFFIEKHIAASKLKLFSTH